MTKRTWNEDIELQLYLTDPGGRLFQRTIRGELPEASPGSVGAFIRQRGMANKAEVAYAFGVTGAVAYTHLRAARELGFVICTGTGRAAQWEPTP